MNIRHSLRTLALVVLLALTAIPPQVTYAATTRATTCQCVTYIKNRFGLSGAIGRSGGAKDMGPYLRARGFRQVSAPVVGAVIIFQPAFGTGINQTYGHVGVVASVSTVNNQWRLTVTGANQGGSLFTSSSCTNVSTQTYKAYSKTTTSVSYWVR